MGYIELLDIDCFDGSILSGKNPDCFSESN